MGNVMAPVPYDVPRLPPKLPGLECFVAELVHFYRERGVYGGGGGVLFGLTIDHLMHAVVGSPTTDGKSSPSRTNSNVEHPLIVLCETAYADALLPLFDDASVVHNQWEYIDEKVYGVVDRVSAYRDHYSICVPHVKEILVVMLQIYEMVRQCQPDASLTFHITNADYDKAVRLKLKTEISSMMRKAAWRLSTELLAMQLDVLEQGGEPLISRSDKSFLFRKMRSSVQKLGSARRVSILMEAINQEKALAQARAREEMEEATLAMSVALKAGKKLRKKAEAAREQAARKLKACTTLQACYRGRLGRKKTHKTRKDLFAVLQEESEQAAAVKMQACCRGRLGRQRASTRSCLRATGAAELVAKEVEEKRRKSVMRARQQIWRTSKSILAVNVLQRDLSWESVLDDGGAKAPAKKKKSASSDASTDTMPGRFNVKECIAKVEERAVKIDHFLTRFESMLARMEVTPPSPIIVHNSRHARPQSAPGYRKAPPLSSGSPTSLPSPNRPGSAAHRRLPPSPPSMLRRDKSKLGASQSIASHRPTFPEHTRSPPPRVHRSPPPRVHRTPHTLNTVRRPEITITLCDGRLMWTR